MGKWEHYYYFLTVVKYICSSLYYSLFLFKKKSEINPGVIYDHAPWARLGKLGTGLPQSPGEHDTKRYLKPLLARAPEPGHHHPHDQRE